MNRRSLTARCSFDGLRLFFAQLLWQPNHPLPAPDHSKTTGQARVRWGSSAEQKPLKRTIRNKTNWARTWHRMGRRKKKDGATAAKWTLLYTGEGFSRCWLGRQWGGRKEQLRGVLVTFTPAEITKKGHLKYCWRTICPQHKVAMATQLPG